MGRKFTVFALFYFVFEDNFKVQAPLGAFIWRGDLTEGFCVTSWAGAYIWRASHMEGVVFGILRYFAVGCSFTTSNFIEFYIHAPDQEPITRSEQHSVSKTSLF